MGKIQSTRLSVINGSIQDKIIHLPGEDDALYVVQRRAPDNRRIVSFDVQVHVREGVGVNIGWLEYSLENVTVDMIDTTRCMNLKLTRGQVCSYTTKTDFKIRCANRGAEWYIDDVLVAETREQSRLFSGLQPCFYTSGRNITIQLVHVEYEEDEKSL